MKVILSLLLTLFAISVFSQSGGTIRGTVYDEESGEPVLFTPVFLEGTDLRLATNDFGFFQFTKLKPGTYTLVIESAEHNRFTQQIEVGLDEIVEIKATLSVGTQMKTHEVKDDQSKETEVRISVNPATKKDIILVPKVGGDNDLINYITAAVPGAITTGDQGGQVYIRGGSPIQNKVLLDGITVFNPFHSIGFFSVFDTDLIATADIYTGGFNAEFGERISSIMDIKTRDGNRNEFDGKISANPFGAKLTLEGPAWNNTKAGGSAGTYVVSLKQSYLNRTSPVLYSYVNDGEGLPFSFFDGFGKFTIAGDNGSNIKFFGFSFNDNVQYQAISQFGWNSIGGGTQFTVVPKGNPMVLSGFFSASQYKIGIEEEGVAPRNSSISGFEGGLDFTYYLNKNEIKYGLTLSGFETDFNTVSSTNRVISQEENNTQFALFITSKFVSKGNKLVVEPSIRLQYYGSYNVLSPEPRFGMKYNLTEDLRIKAAGGVYSQNLVAANSDRDVVNLFYGFLSAPDDLQDEITLEDGSTREIKTPLQRANHLIAGFEYDVSKKITVNVEGYIKDFRQLTNMNRNKIFDSDQTDKPAVLRNDFIVETGLAKGIDFLIKYKSERVNVFGVYSLGKVDRWDGFISYPPVFDRRHSANLVASIKFGEDKSWVLDQRYNFGSGFPTTPTAGYYQQVGFEDGINSNVTTDNSNEVSIIYGNLGENRLPNYHRFDVTLNKFFRFYETNEAGIKTKKVKQEIEVNLGITNIFSHKNVFYVNRLTGEVVRQLPIMPSLGFSYTL
jgi:hypothetical protein